MEDFKLDNFEAYSLSKIVNLIDTLESQALKLKEHYSHEIAQDHAEYCKQSFESWLLYMKKRNSVLHTALSGDCTGFTKVHWNTHLSDSSDIMDKPGAISCRFAIFELYFTKATTIVIEQEKTRAGSDLYEIGFKDEKERVNILSFKKTTQQFVNMLGQRAKKDPDVLKFLQTPQLFNSTPPSRTIDKFLCWILLLYFVGPDFYEFMSLTSQDLIWHTETQRKQFLDKISNMKVFCSCCMHMHACDEEIHKIVTQLFQTAGVTPLCIAEYLKTQYQAQDNHIENFGSATKPCTVSSEECDVYCGIFTNESPRIYFDHPRLTTPEDVYSIIATSLLNEVLPTSVNDSETSLTGQKRPRLPSTEEDTQPETKKMKLLDV